MKRLMNLGLWVILLLVAFSARSQSFTVTIPSTDPYQSLCKPVRAGTSFNLTVSVKCNSGGPYTVSINRTLTFGTFNSWFSIENNSQVVNTGSTVNFYLTVSPPIGTDELDFPFSLNFDAYKNNINNPFNQNEFVVIIDNSPPEVLDVAIDYTTSSATTSTVRAFFYATDARSAQYTQANQSSGVGGIKSYLLALRNSIGQTIQTQSYNATQTNNYHTFSNLSPNTSYSVVVSATDLADNTRVSSPLQVTTPPRAPVNLTATSPNYCSVTLAWDASPGASAYRVCNTTVAPNTQHTTTATSYTFSGLEPNVTYDFYVEAVGTSGVSERSYTAGTTVSIPIISGSTPVCTSNTPFTLNNLPQGFTVTWSSCSNLRYVSGQGTTSYVVRARNTSVSGFGTVTATLSGPCDPVEIVKEVWVGEPSQPTEIYGFPYNGYTFTGSTSYYFSVSPHSLQTVSSFEWSVGGGTIQNGAGSNPLEVLTHEPPPGTTGNFDLSVRVGNTCGSSPWLLRTGYVIGSGGLGLLNVSPNPASVEITISEEEPANNNIPWVLRLMSQGGSVMVNVTAVLPKTINVQGLQPGVYVLHARRGQYVEQQVVIIE